MVSVIVPVYNVELYLSRCVDSIINQSYKDLEIILIDDGSQDNSPDLCDKYSAVDNRIRVIHKTNGGLSSARNAGLDLALGDYICFVDSDDWISSTAVEYSIGLMKRYHADVVETGILCTSDYVTNIPKQEKIEIFKGKSILQDYLLSSTKGAGYSVCKCMFSKGSIGGVRFREGYNNEDIDFKYKVLSISNVLVKSNIINYFYFQGVGSITTGGFKIKDFDLDIASEILVDLTKDEDFGSIAFLARVKKARCPFSHLCKIALYGCEDDSIDVQNLVEQLLAAHRHNLFLLLHSPIPFSRKVLALSFAISFNATKAILKIFG